MAMLQMVSGERTAIFPLQVLVGKVKGDVVDDDRLLVANEGGIVLAVADEALVHGVRHSWLG